MISAPYYLWVGERPQSVVILLPCCVPQAQAHGYAVADHRGRIIVEPMATQQMGT